MARAAARKAMLPLDVFFQVIEDPSVNIIQEDWQAPIMVYLCHYYEPGSNKESIRIQQRAKAYQIIEDEL
jgi:hypothetical protein